MTRIYLFILEITTALLMIEIWPTTKTEMANIGLIIIVRIAFYFFEKKFPNTKSRVLNVFKKQNHVNTDK